MSFPSATSGSFGRPVWLILLTLLSGVVNGEEMERVMIDSWGPNTSGQGDPETMEIYIGGRGWIAADTATSGTWPRWTWDVPEGESAIWESYFREHGIWIYHGGWDDTFGVGATFFGDDPWFHGDPISGAGSFRFVIGQDDGSHSRFFALHTLHYENSEWVWAGDWDDAGGGYVGSGQIDNPDAGDIDEETSGTGTGNGQWAAAVQVYGLIDFGQLAMRLLVLLGLALAAFAALTIAIGAAKSTLGWFVRRL